MIGCMSALVGPSDRGAIEDPCSRADNTQDRARQGHIPKRASHFECSAFYTAIDSI